MILLYTAFPDSTELNIKFVDTHHFSYPYFRCRFQFLSDAEILFSTCNIRHSNVLRSRCLWSKRKQMPGR